MFSKFKKKKEAPAPTPTVYSGGVAPAPAPEPKHRSSRKEQFPLDNLGEHGIHSCVYAMAFDPVQLLLAVLCDGEVVVMGERGVVVRLRVQHTGNPLITLKFVRGVFLVGVDTEDMIVVFLLHTYRILAHVRAPAAITSVESDPLVEWLVVGLATGTVSFLDVENGLFVPFRVSALAPHPVVAVRFHPRDLGQLLIASHEQAAVVLLQTGQVRLSFKHTLPQGAPGGGDPRRSASPSITNALWHPNGLHLVTVHNDNSFVFWDAVSGSKLLVRTLHDVFVDKPLLQLTHPLPQQTRFERVWWVADENPDSTRLVVLGGDVGSPDEMAHAVTVLEFGVAPTYSITSYDRMADHYAYPQASRTIALGAVPAVDLLPLPRSDPFFAGLYNPVYLAVLHDDGGVGFIDTREWHYDLVPCTPLALALGASTSVGAVEMENVLWLNMATALQRHIKERFPPVAEGGLPAIRGSIPKGPRCVSVVGHPDGRVQLWDLSFGSVEELAGVVECRLADMLPEHPDLAVTKVAFAAVNGQMAVAVRGANDVVLLQYGRNPRHASPSVMAPLKFAAGLGDISGRRPQLREGFMPVSVVHPPSNYGPVTAVGNSEIIGFTAIAYKTGQVVVVDRRGPAVIGRLESGVWTQGGAAITCWTFAVAQWGQDAFLSVLLVGGTLAGNVVCFRLVPQAPSNRFVAEYAGICNAEVGLVVSVTPIHATTHAPSPAQARDTDTLSRGVAVPGVLAVVGSKGAATVKLSPKMHVAKKRLADGVVIAGGVAQLSSGLHVVGVLSLGETTGWLLPDLKALFHQHMPYGINPETALGNTTVLPSGEIVVRHDWQAVGVLKVFGRGITATTYPPDTLFNDRMYLPARPVTGVMALTRGDKPLDASGLRAVVAPSRVTPTLLEADMAARLARGVPSNEPQPGAGAGAGAPKQNLMLAQGQVQFNGFVRTMQQGLDTMNSKMNDVAAVINDKTEGANDALLKSAFKSKLGM